MHQGVERLTGGGEGVVTGCCRESLDRHLKHPQEPPEENKYANSTKSANSAIGVLVVGYVNAGCCGGVVKRAYEESLETLWGKVCKL